MSLFFFEGFDDDSTSRLDLDINDGFANGRWSGSRAVRVPNNSQGPEIHLPAPVQVVTLGAAIRADGNLNWSRFLEFIPDDNGDRIYFSIEDGSDVYFRAHRGNGLTDAGTVIGTAEHVISHSQQWNDYIEVRIEWGDPALVQMRVNEALVGSFIGTTSSSGTGWDRIHLGFRGSSTLNSRDFYYDDVYVTLQDGVSPQGFIGDVRAIMIEPASDGSVTDWSPSEGTDNYPLVADVSHLTYVETDNVNSVDLYGFSALPSIPSTHPYIHGVTAGVSAMKTDTDSRSVRIVANNGSDRENGPDHEIEGGWNSVRKVWNKDPFKDDLWDEADIAAYEYGFESR